jgi:hypothetical protein
MSINNFAAGTSDALGAVMMKLFGITSSSFVHLTALLLTCNLLSLLPLPLIGWVPNESAADAAAAASAAAAAAVGDADSNGAVSLTVKSGAVVVGGSGVGLLASPRQRGPSSSGSGGRFGGGKSYQRVPEVEVPDWGEKHS